MNDPHITNVAEPAVLNQEPAPGGGAEGYDKDSVEVFRDTAHIRKRAGMYIGDTSTAGLHHLVYELIYNSVDEALAGYCKSIQVRIGVDGSISVADDGRGIPVEEHPVERRPTLEVVMTTVGAGAKFGKGAYKVSAGLHGIGAKTVTALSEWVEARVCRNGHVYVQEYERGQPITEVREIGAGKHSGTRITFRPDPEIFGEATFDYNTLEMRLRELAFLNKGLAIELFDERTGKKDLFKYDGGIAEYVEYMNGGDAFHKPIYVDRTVEHVREDGEKRIEENVRVEVAMQYTTGDEERVRCYANNAYNSAGGTHLSGFRTGLTRALKAYGEKEGHFKNVTPEGQDFREGLTAVVSVQVPEPQLEAQTKVRLNNPEVEGIVSSVVYEHLSKYLEESPKDAQKIMRQVVQAAEAREAAAKARKALKDRKSILSGGGLPGKLMECTTRDRDASELFLVEGDSAGGSAESGRDRMFQAILPLRGKPLNVEKAREQKLLDNQEICSIISAVGIDIGNTTELEKLRYGKVVILTDADVDGQHIRTLLLTFFYRQMQELVTKGHIYVARPPLFKVTQKKHVRYVATTEEMTRELFERGLDGTKLTVLPPTVEGRPAPPPLVFEKERLRALLQVLNDLEQAIVILERRGLSLAEFLKQDGPRGLPTHRVILAGQTHWFRSIDEVDQFRQAEQTRLGRELVVGDATPGQNGNGNGHGPSEPQGPTFFVQELHEVRGQKGLNRGLERLREMELRPTDLVPAPRIAGREPPPRHILENGDTKRVLAHLRELPLEVRRLGERGLTITRFKGLGEMDPEELWETTLDPARRTLLQVRLEDAVQADDLFRQLMGDEVKDRREFIQKFALEVKDLDYHGA
jgi:DNA gyrase subunit B